MTRITLTNIFANYAKDIAIAHDLDDWLIPFVPGFLEWRNKHYDKKFKYEDIKTYNMWDIFGTTKEEEVENALAFHNSKEALLIKPNPEALKILEYLIFYKNIIITSRQHETREATHKQVCMHLSKYFPNTDNIFLTNNFSKSGPSISKADIAKEHGVVLAFDDSLGHAQNYSGIEIICALPDNPWNQCDVMPKNVYRFINAEPAILWMHKELGL
ncbi:MAG: hypothetical protein ACP5NV_06665 [Candidatus Woesearchaeota archaeon]